MKLLWKPAKTCAPEKKKTSEYRVRIINYDDKSIRVIVEDGIFNDRENMLSVASDLEKCAAQIKGDLPPEKLE
jgi:hypothetical protein